MRLIQIDNIAAHYRAPIYMLMDREFGCDFCFGDKWDDIKKMDYSLFTHCIKEVKNVFFSQGFYFQKGVTGLIWKDYDSYILLGEVRCLSNWCFIFLSLFYPRKRIYFWTHGVLEKAGLLKRLSHRFFYSFCDGVFVYNERSTQLLAEEGIPKRKLHTIYNSLDYDAQLPIRNSLKPSHLYQEHFGNDNKNIVFIGRLTQVKRFDLLIDAMAQLKERGELVNVTFVGDGVERHNMERRVDELGIREQVWFYGASYDEQKNAELIFNADVCVSPGNIGLTAMHVLMFGCPAITNDDFDRQMPEFEAIREGITGSFFKADDSHSLANNISQWFNVHSDDREKVRQACYSIIDSKWNPHNQIRILKEVLKD